MSYCNERFNFEAFSRTPPGFIDLLDVDKICLMDQLRVNNGSKESIKNIRIWLNERAHSLCSSSVVFREFIFSIYRQENSFAKILHSIYVLNDLLFNASEATTVGPYTLGFIRPGNEQVVNPLACLWPQLPSILWASSQAAHDDLLAREKLKKLAELWLSKHVIDEKRRDTLLEAIESPTEIIPPPIPILTKPLSASLPFPPSGYPPFFNAQQGLPTPMGPTASLQPLLALHPNLYMNPPAPPLPLASQIAVDLKRTTVGTMSNLLRQSLKVRNVKYIPLNPSNLSSIVQPIVEAGRLDVRIDDFYKRYAETDDRTYGANKKGIRR